MKRDPKSLLWDARDAADAIAAMTAGKAFADFDPLALGGGAAIRDRRRGARPAFAHRSSDGWEIPDLREIIAFRNILIHGYALIDRARVWRVVEDDLPRLQVSLSELLSASK